MDNRKGLMVAVCGLIGSGKSTLVSELANKYSDIIQFQEPVESNPFLELYYKDPVRWAYAMQVNLLWERYLMTQEAYLRSRNNITVLDSTIYSDMAFALVQKKSNYFTPEEYSSYIKMHEIVATRTPYPDLTIWLEFTPEETVERINKRARDCESGIPIEYLKDLRDAYGTVLLELSNHTKVVNISAAQSVEAVVQEASYYIENELLEKEHHPCYR